MDDPTRRRFLAAAGALPVMAAASDVDTATTNRIAADLETYIVFGNKQSGGVGDRACGHWLAGELEAAGFAVKMPKLSVPFFDAADCTIQAGESRAILRPQPIVVPTPPTGVSGPLVRVDSAGQASAPLAGAIALIDLPYGRWSSALAKPIRGPIDYTLGAGAKAAVVITNGPTGKIVALNADGRAPMFTAPVGLIAPIDAGLFLKTAMTHGMATVTLAGAVRHSTSSAVSTAAKADGSSSRRRGQAGPIVPASAVAGSPRGCTLRAQRRLCFPTTTSPSSATAGMNMKIWAPKRP